jgi:eukaryotic-like serine/threonine-protein kinase
LAFATPEGTHFIRLLGGGSVFQVGLVRARDQDLVCKRLAPHALETHEGRAAMVREAKLLSLVDHPALPQLVHVGIDARGPFFLETFVVGTSLREVRRGWSGQDKPIPPTLVRHIALASLETLAAVHELTDSKGPLGVVHGDISPDHVIFGPLGEVRFVDLGAARFRELDPDVDTDDRGTIPYAAPEVVRGDAKPGQTTDCYALCASLLWFATGEDLCTSTTDAARVAEVALHGIRRELVDRMVGFTPHERAQFHAALDPDPPQRPTSIRQLLQALMAASPQRDIAVEAR